MVRPPGAGDWDGTDCGAEGAVGGFLWAVKSPLNVFLKTSIYRARGVEGLVLCPGNPHFLAEQFLAGLMVGR